MTTSDDRAAFNRSAELVDELAQGAELAGDRLAVERARELAQTPLEIDNPGKVAARIGELVATVEGLARRLERRLGR